MSDVVFRTSSGGLFDLLKMACSFEFKVSHFLPKCGFGSKH
ncbi:hypothetical protein BVRB_6g133800 [Beta vulgaris subsp. vulgaris]|nr:hypothetical protein BVRB_6g133800 [Beta vulgaris subsp. vulgaris]